MTIRRILSPIIFAAAAAIGTAAMADHTPATDLPGAAGSGIISTAEPGMDHMMGGIGSGPTRKCRLAWAT